MQGMRFLVLGEDGPTNHGVISQQITPERYLCAFARVPAVSLVVTLDQIMSWTLFPSDKAMNLFIADGLKKDSIEDSIRGEGTLKDENDDKE